MSCVQGEGVQRGVAIKREGKNARRKKVKKKTQERLGRGVIL